MTKDSTSSHPVAGAFQGLSFGNLIGPPLAACAEAQEEQAKIAAEFMKEAGLDLDKDAKEKE